MEAGLKEPNDAQASALQLRNYQPVCQSQSEANEDLRFKARFQMYDNNGNGQRAATLAINALMLALHPNETRKKVRVPLWKIEIELCKAKLCLSHRCQPLTHNTVSGAGVAVEGGGQACQATQALWGKQSSCKGLTNRPPPN